MKCNKCNNNSSKVIDTRLLESEEVRFRRYMCLVCSFRWSTYEYAPDSDLTCRLKKEINVQNYKIKELEKEVTALRKIEDIELYKTANKNTINKKNDRIKQLKEKLVDKNKIIKELIKTDAVIKEKKEDKSNFVKINKTYFWLLDEKGFIDWKDTKGPKLIETGQLIDITN